MGDISRGQDYQLRLFDAEGELVRTIQPNDMTFGVDENRERQQRCGTRKQTPRQTVAGHSGTATFEREDFTLDDMVDAMIQNYLNGTPIDRIDIIQTIYIPEIGASRSYRYPNALFGWNDNAGGQTDPVSLTLEWTSEHREEI